MKNNLEKLRKERGIKQEELAAALEVSRQTIGSLENGRYNPSIILAFKIARYFQMSIEDIFIYEEDDNEKIKKIIWYGGYVAAALVILIIAVTDLPEAADAGLAILFAILFSVSHVTLWHDKMMEKDRDYRIEVMDERNIAIKEKAGQRH